MSRTINLKRQHDAALELVKKVRQVAARPITHDLAYTLGLHISQLTGLLRIHFAQEDKVLYPYMIASLNEAAAEAATAFQAEMGDLGSVYLAFVQRWGNSKAIEGDFAGFRRESELVFNALAERITRENELLYPLADAIQSHEVSRTA